MVRGRWPQSGLKCGSGPWAGPGEAQERQGRVILDTCVLRALTCPTFGKLYVLYISKKCLRLPLMLFRVKIFNLNVNKIVNIVGLIR